MPLLDSIPSDWGPKFEGTGGAITRTRTGPNEINLTAPTHMALVMFTPQPGRQIALNSDRKSDAFVPAGSVEIIPARSELFARWLTDKENLLVALDSERLTRLALLEFDTDTFDLQPPRIGHLDKRALTIASLLRDELVLGAAGNEDCLESLITVFGVHLLRQYSNVRNVCARPPAGGLSPLCIRKIRDFVAEHLDQKLPVERLAQVVGMSPSHFTRAFHASTGYPPHKFVICLRLEKARHLIATSDVPLEAVARACGFHGHSHLSATMRRFLGEAPSVFRSQGHRAIKVRPAR